VPTTPTTQLIALSPADVGQFNSQLRSTLQTYSDWGVQVGVGMITCIFMASLIGQIIRSI